MLTDELWANYFFIQLSLSIAKMQNLRISNLIFSDLFVFLTSNSTTVIMLNLNAMEHMSMIFTIRTFLVIINFVIGIYVGFQAWFSIWRKCTHFAFQFHFSHFMLRAQMIFQLLLVEAHFSTYLTTLLRMIAIFMYFTTIFKNEAFSTNIT